MLTLRIAATITLEHRRCGVVHTSRNRAPHITFCTLALCIAAGHGTNLNQQSKIKGEKVFFLHHHLLTTELSSGPTGKYSKTSTPSHQLAQECNCAIAHGGGRREMRFVVTPSLLTLSLTDHKRERKLAAFATCWEKSPTVTRTGVCWQQHKAISPVIVLADCVIFILFKGTTFLDGRGLCPAYGLLPTCFIGLLAALKLQQL